MSNSTQALTIAHAHKILDMMLKCHGMENHLLESGAEATDFANLGVLLEDANLSFFSIKRVIDRQIRKAQSAVDFIPQEDQDSVGEIIYAALRTIPNLTCDICSLNGHTASSCWLNGQIYNTCRSLGADAQDANFLWREAIKLKRVAKDEAMRQMAASKRA